MSAPARVVAAGRPAPNTSMPASPAAPWAKAWGCLRLAASAARADDPLDPQARLRSRAARLSKTTKALCALHGLDVRVQGALPKGVVVMVCNHLGFIDPLILGTLRPCAPIAKAEVADWPVIGAAVDRLGTMFVQRAEPHSGATVLRRASRALEAGVSVLNFPEGTTTDGQGLAPFKRGIFGLCQMLGVPVVPIHLTVPPELLWVGDDYFLPHYVRFARRPRTEVLVRIGAPIEPTSAPTPRALAERTREAMTALSLG